MNFNRDVTDSAQAVVNNRDVPGAFTKAGYQFMANALPEGRSVLRRRAMGSMRRCRKRLGE